MPRRARLRIADVPFHLIQRGNNRSRCFFTPEDHLHYLHHLRELSVQYAVHVHAYVLMTNHVHLLATPGSADGLSLMMKSLGQRHVQRVNRMQGRTGSLWEGRFRSCLVDTDGYLLVCHRYIECNPVRAGMVQRPGDYRWSSHRANALGEPDDLLTRHPLLEELTEGGSRLAAYRGLFEEALAPSVIDQIRIATLGGHALGGVSFEERLSLALKRRVIRGKHGRPRKTGTVPVFPG